MTWRELATHPDLPGMQGRVGKGGFEGLMGTIERSKIEVPELSAAALPNVLVSTGEGPDDRRSCAFHPRRFIRVLDPEVAVCLNATKRRRSTQLEAIATSRRRCGRAHR
jgi:hypothetical protein